MTQVSKTTTCSLLSCYKTNENINEAKILGKDIYSLCSNHYRTPMMLRALGLKEKKFVNHEPKVSDSDTFLAFSQPLAKVTGQLNHTKYGVSF